MTRPTRPSRIAPAARPASRERGFLLLTVMVLLFVATLVIGWGMKRASMQSRIADLRIEDYRLHHERLGLIAVAQRWMRQENPESLAEQSASRSAAYQATLPDDAEITIWVSDGQGLLLGRAESAQGGVIREFLLDALREMPPGSGEMIRSVGPVAVSLGSAPEDVLMAVAGGDERILELLMKMRDDPPESDQRLKLEITRAELDDVLTNRLANLLTVEPRLWRLEAEVTDQHGSRRYEILIEFQGNIIRTHTCRLMAEPEEDRGERRR